VIARHPRPLPRPTAACAALLGGCLVLAAAARAGPLDQIPNPRVRDGTWVADTAGALRPATVARLNASLDDFERTTGGEMAVVVVASLDGLSVEEATVQLFERWGIGKREQDNGLLFLWSTGDRRVRVEVGYGLEGVLPDGKVGAILDAYVIPRFRAGEFDAGVVAGVEAILAAARDEHVPLPAAATGRYEEQPGVARGVALGALGAVPVVLVSAVGLRRWRRHRRRRCPQCRARMRRLTETEDDELLDDGQRTEERIRSVDYDVWTCPSCAHHFTLRYPKWITGYSTCPQCANRTKSSTEEVIHAATTSANGSARVTEQCAFCAFTHVYTRTLPRLSSSTSSGGGGGSSSGFGGGRSGGGGASRGY
jgi:uncharacterized protein